MDERIVFTNPDGSCGIDIPTGDIPVSEVLARVQARSGLTNVRQITTAELPSDRLFREAWDDSNPEDFIGLDLTKAQAIAHDMRRADRQVKLKPLDEEYTYAGTSSARKTAINTERNGILTANAQVQTDIDLAADEVALRAVLSTAEIV